jgi:hypothetical protein
MDLLSAALASELQARLAQSARVVEDTTGAHATREEESHGARLFVAGTMQEASWTRPRSGIGSYRLKVALSATLARTNAPDLLGFWTKTVELEQPRRGWPAQELAGMVRKAFSGAVEELAQALAKDRQ